MHAHTGINSIGSSVRGVRKTIKSEVAAAATMEISAAELRGKEEFDVHDAAIRGRIRFTLHEISCCLHILL